MPYDSMNIAITGMDAYQAQIDVISNNIANVGTAGYKGQNLTFQDLLYQTQQPASGPTKTNGGVNVQQLGIGVRTGATDTNFTQGGIQTTGVPTNMMINGDGYFILANADGTGAPKYTRNGDFSLNANGLLYDPSSGSGVMGYTATSQGVISANGTPGPIQIPLGLKVQAIATGAGLKQGPTGDKVFDASFVGNLDSTQYSAVVSNGGVVLPSSLATTGTTIYDSLGTPHQIYLTFQPQALTVVPTTVNNASGTAVTAATEWAYTVSSTDGTLFTGGASVAPTQYAFFDVNGQFINTSSTVNPSSATVHQAGALPSSAAGDQLSVTQWGAPPKSNNAATQPPATPGPIGLDFGIMTSTSQASNAAAGQQNGAPPGTLSNISVGQDGTITGAFSNGAALALGRVAVATFQNQAGLTRIGGGVYQTSPNSGAAQIGTANSGRFGAIVGNSLELSNVSIADEFTKLITAQNAFTANSKSITTANNDDQTVLNLIH